MSDLTITAAHNDYRLQGTMSYADLGVANSRIRFYDASDNLLVTMVLTKPCGSIVSHKLVLTQAAPGGDQITVQGTAVRAEWINGNGDIVGSGAATDEAGDGPFKIAGTTGTLLYTGAYALLGVTELD